MLVPQFVIILFSLFLQRKVELVRDNLQLFLVFSISQVN